MKQCRYLFTGLILLAFGLSGCSQSEEDISSSDITSFADQSSPTTVAELTRQLRAYNVSLGMAEVTTRMSRNDKIKIGIDDAEEYTCNVLYMIKNGNVDIDDSNALYGAIQIGYASLKMSKNLKSNK